MTPFVPPPTAEAQLTFLSKLQRLFAEGDFTATYKHALLIALADLAVEVGANDGSEMPLSIRQVAERFIQLYWRQSVPYGAGRVGAVPGVLVQNNGAQAAVVSAVSAFRARFHVASPQAARALPEYSELLTAVTQTVSAQPLRYLQNFGGGTDEFLYERAGPGKIRLKPGVTFCLRRFQPLVQQLARSHWIGHVKSNHRNHSILSDADDLEAFLFSTPRQALRLLVEGLQKIDGTTCFYCRQQLAAVDVDHFIPFAQYPRDLAHNFVLAHPGCNRSKSDTLAGRPHLERWLERLQRKVDDIAEVGLAAGLVADAAVNRQVAAWGYTSAAAGSGRAWLSPAHYEVVDSGYLSHFVA